MNGSQLFKAWQKPDVPVYFQASHAVSYVYWFFPFPEEFIPFVQLSCLLERFNAELEHRYQRNTCTWSELVLL